MYSRDVHKFMRPPEASTFMGVSPSTLAKWRHYGTGPGFIRAGRAILYDPADIEAWLNTRRRSSTSG